MSPREVRGAEGPRLDARNIVARHGSLVVCRDVSLSVAPGELVALIGPNGAGKTSFIGALAGAVASRGEIRLGDTLLSGRPPHQRTRAGLATVPDYRGLFAPLTVAENMRLGSQFLAKAGRAEAVEAAVARFPFLRQRWTALAGSLSGGEQQMLAIAKCLAGKPRALLLDEPSQGLAPIIVDSVVEVLAQLRESGLPILLVEQNYGLVERTATRFAVMVGGQIVLEGPPAELAHRDRIARLFLQRRLTQRLN